MIGVKVNCVYIFILALSSSAILAADTTSSKPSSKYAKPPSYNVDSNLEESDTILFESCHDDVPCLMRASDDKQGLEAIRSLHRQLDDDNDGDIDLSESKDFLREELKYEKDAEKRQRAFHRNDMHISVKELWEAWIKSEVHNWTIEQTADWLSTHVELPQYVSIFIFKRVTGAQLPRLATSNGQYLANVLGIKDPIHKQKIMLKAMDVVLFGPPKVENANYTKDAIFVSLLLSVSVSFYYVYRQSKNSKEHLHRLMKHMDSLQKADSELKDLQGELEQAKEQQQMVTMENQNLEKRLREQLGDDSEISNSNRDLEIAQLREEIEMLKSALEHAEGELVDRYRSTPLSLQPWLQYTYEIESKTYAAKKSIAEKQIDTAKEACEKLRKKRSSLIGAFISTHGKSIDDVDKSIMDARTALSEVTTELQERIYRWHQIEQICGFPIVNNKGLSHLEEKLYKNSIKFKGCANGQDIEDDTSSNYSTPAGQTCDG